MAPSPSGPGPDVSTLFTIESNASGRNRHRTGESLDDLVVVLGLAEHVASRLIFPGFTGRARPAAAAEF
jgi:hypothetical protein